VTQRPSATAATADFDSAFVADLEAQGISPVAVCGSRGLCGVKRFQFTWGLLVNLQPFGYHLRYCYEHEAEALAALASWDGAEHPGGPWIKRKGAGVDIVDPEFATDL
jgi:hypothetical protein